MSPAPIARILDSNATHIGADLSDIAVFAERILEAFRVPSALAGALSIIGGLTLAA